MDPWEKLYKRAQQDKRLIMPGLLALLNGYLHKVLFFITGKKVKIGKAFRVYGKFNIRGSGRVAIGDNCFIISDYIKPVSFLTSRVNAEIKIGNNVGFNGTTIQCYDRITIHDWCNIADAYIVDSQAHHLSADRRFRSSDDLVNSPITIDKNAWISTRVVISYGVTIGKNSVIGAFTLVRKNIKENSFYAGIPARFIKKIPPSHIPNFNIDDY